MNLSDSKLILFDLDGTLLDAYSAIEKALNNVREKFNLEAISYSEVKRAVGRGDRVLIEDYFEKNNVKEALTLYRQLHKGALIKYGKLLPGAEEILKYFKEKGYLLGLGTNRPAIFTRLIVEHLNISNLFDCIICADELGAFKPDPEMIFETMRRFSLNSKDIVYIGDMTIDIETANNAGVRSIALTTGSSSREELLAMNPSIIIDNLSRLKKFFNS